MEMKLKLVMDMEVDKVADEVADMEIDKQTDMDVKISNEEFIDVTLVIGGQISNQCKWRHLVTKFSTNTSGATWWPNLEPIQVAPPGDQISN